MIAVCVGLARHALEGTGGITVLRNRPAKERPRGKPPSSGVVFSVESETPLSAETPEPAPAKVRPSRAKPKAEATLDKATEALADAIREAERGAGDVEPGTTGGPRA